MSHSRRRWGRRGRWSHWHSKWVNVLNRYSYTLNSNYDAEIQSTINIINALKSAIHKNMYNNCNNENTLLNSVGLQECGIFNDIAMFQNDIQLIKNQSNRVMEKLENTKDFPQYAQAKRVDDQINAYYNYDPLRGRRFFLNPNYTYYTKKQILNRLKAMKKHIAPLYDVCAYGSTHIGLDTDDIPICVKDEYVKSQYVCGEAIEKSGPNGVGQGYGHEKLTKLWTDVSNSIPGNLNNTSSLILNTSNASCTKWVKMFNKWEALEEKALSEPCLPERPIASTNNPVLIEMADNWNKSASDQIKQLKLRLLKIQKYIKNYPNILDIKSTGVTLAPSTLPPTAMIKKDFSQSKDGESPMQYLEMIIPNGKPGKQGKIGKVGMVGQYGKSGLKGPVGDIGNNAVPTFYTNN